MGLEVAGDLERGDGETGFARRKKVRVALKKLGLKSNHCENHHPLANLREKRIRGGEFCRRLGILSREQHPYKWACPNFGTRGGVNG